MLSDKQQRILNFIRNFLTQRGYPPTIRDIARGCHISSTSVVDYNLRLLEKEGYIRCDAGISRGIGLVEEIKKATVRVPVIGLIAAGEPIPVPDADTWSNVAWAEAVELSRDLIQSREGIYALRVKGDSMIDALINDGDLVLMQQVSDADDGDMVAAWLKAEREVTLKKFYREGNRICLQPANSQMQPIYLKPEGVEIQGRVTCVIRQLT
jgi:repressor LexA